MTETTKTPAGGPAAAICFEPEAYVLTGRKLMGRQSAGNAFLRAAVAGRQGGPLCAYTPHRNSARVFARLVHEIDPAAAAMWCPAHRLDVLARIGTLYLPGPNLGEAVRLRLRAGSGAFSLCGVTHTLASDRAMAFVADMLAAPVMPWDAVVCTSQAAVATLRQVFAAEHAYLRWRFGAAVRATLPQLPVIPLGVHAGDFAFSAAERAAARAALGIAGDEVVALFVGRLSFHAKAHPHAMYAGLQAAARRSGRKLVLLQYGRFPNRRIEETFKSGARLACPDVRCLYGDGADPEAGRQSWAAADLFLSLSDNIQETFGLTPLEAMAAGLPVVVTDWDGYKDTVRDGIDGFRIPTAMPPPSVLGNSLARDYETGRLSYDLYCGIACQTVAVDLRVLGDRLVDLVTSPELRQRLGETGRERARQVFDWSLVYGQYRDLWQELARRRRAAREDPAAQRYLAAAPRAAASRLNPFRIFGHYPTFRIGAATLVTAADGATAEAYAALARHPLFDFAGQVLPSTQRVERLLAAIGDDEIPVRTLVQRAAMAAGPVVLALSILGKMGLVHLAAPSRLSQAAPRAVDPAPRE